MQNLLTPLIEQIKTRLDELPKISSDYNQLDIFKTLRKIFKIIKIIESIFSKK